MEGFQYNLMPVLAGSFASHFTYHRISKVYTTMQTAMKSGDSDTLLKILPDLHATSAGLVCEIYIFKN